MKISQKQAQLLAREICSQLRARKVYKIDEPLKEQLKLFIAKRNELKRIVEDAESVLQKHDSGIYKIVGREANRKVEAYYTLDKMIERIEEKNIPSTQQIEDEIILKSMFANEDDMQKFVDAIVAKYSKKLQTKILSN